MNALEKLREVVDEIKAGKDSWALAQRLVQRFPVDADESARAFKDRDAAALDALVTRLEHPTRSGPADLSSASDVAVSEKDMAAAMRAFRKRLKLARLADESKLGGRYVSGGRKSEIDAIQPPNEFAPEVWQALVKAGQLKHTGQGFYAEP
jgi:hypothetical protein